ncbi:MAG: hypothetical protein PWP76_426 [Candidatus Diapherotrites archaeon]|nr:hypothetical protein [Candidatus Diapherotrites archaeon]MDN5367121.1 hypothetical protein [Candidatus Diapherotrites archaeon]
MVEFEEWWGRVLSRAEELAKGASTPKGKILMRLAMAVLDREELANKFVLRTDRTPWALVLRETLTITKHCKGVAGNVALECIDLTTIPKLAIALEPDETTLAIHAFYNGGDVPDLSRVDPHTERVQDWVLFAAIAGYPSFKGAVKRSWGTDKLLVPEKSAEGSVRGESQ